jgi:hypothetical protein
MLLSSGTCVLMLLLLLLLLAPGAYNTDAYYQELDQGFGDVGVDQVRKEWREGRHGACP